jgi:uncharacterized protein (TIRG00374 family)
MISGFLRKIKKNLFTIISLTVTFIILMYFFFSSDGVENLGDILMQLQPFWLIMSLVFMLIYWMLEAVMLHIITVGVYPEKWSFHSSFINAMTGMYYSALTPFATGEPMQIYYMKRQGMDIGPASSVVALKSLSYSIVLTLYALILMVWRVGFFRTNVPDFFFLAGIGLALNILSMLVLLLFAFNKQLALKIIRGIFTFLHKIRIVKSLEKSLNWATTQVGMFNDSSKVATKNPGVVIKTFVLSVFQLTFFFLVPYCIYRSFGLHGASIVNMVAAQAFVTMVSVVIPLPGGSGGAEGSFYLFFSIFFSSASIISAILIWRLITYYSNIVICGLFVTLDSRRSKKSVAATDKKEASE